MSDLYVEQLDIILKFLKGNSTHPTAEHVHKELLRVYPDISLTTVRLELSKLVETGEIKELDTDPYKKRFEGCMNLHDHFYCRVCGTVYDKAHDAEFTAHDPQHKKSGEGHRVNTAGINYKGVCKNCEAVYLKTVNKSKFYEKWVSSLT